MFPLELLQFVRNYSKTSAQVTIQTLFIHFNLNATDEPIYKINKANNYTIKIYCLGFHQKSSSEPKKIP